jgi:hypothetical protein
MGVPLFDFFGMALYVSKPHPLVVDLVWQSLCNSSSTSTPHTVEMTTGWDQDGIGFWNTGAFYVMNTFQGVTTHRVSVSLVLGVPPPPEHLSPSCWE